MIGTTTVRATVLAMAIGTVLAASAGAATPGPVCREECAPRIQRDCGDLRGKARRRCRRRLVNACKATTPEAACSLGADGADGGSTGTGAGAGTASGSGVQTLTAALGNKLVTVETSRLFSGGSITESRKMRLCSSGSVALDDTTITSTIGLDTDNTFDDTKTLSGTWKVRLVNGAPVLELSLGEPTPTDLAITQDAQGGLFLDGTRADVADASAECGATPAGGSTGGSPDGAAGGATGGGSAPDVAAQVTQILAGHALILTETNSGFGTRTTTIVLCDSARYVEDVTASAAPGRVQESIGSWRVVLDGGQPVLVLTDDAGTPAVRLTIRTDAQQNLLLNGIVAIEGDASAVPAICAQI
jgi:hypothetical protein